MSLKCPICGESTHVRAAMAVADEHTKYSKKGNVVYKSLIGENLRDFRYPPQVRSNRRDCSSVLLVGLIPLTLLYGAMSFFADNVSESTVAIPLAAIALGWLLHVYLRFAGNREILLKQKQREITLKKMEKWNKRVSDGLYCERCGIRFDKIGIF